MTHPLFINMFAALKGSVLFLFNEFSHIQCIRKNENYFKIDSRHRFSVMKMNDRSALTGQICARSCILFILVL